MLLELSVENFKSFSKEQIFKTYASNTGNKNNSINNVRYYGQNEKEKVCKVYKTNVIYGLNNSGKSNFIEAIKLITSLVKNSWYYGLNYKSYKFLFYKSNNEEYTKNYFRLDPKYKNQPSKFRILFVGEDKIKYEYSFSCDNERVFNEKLLFYPKGQEKLCFERIFNKETSKYNYNTKNLKGNSSTQINSIIGDTREDCLFLSTAIKYGNNTLKPVITFLTKKLYYSIDNFLDFKDINFEIIQNEEFKNIYKKILNDKSLVDIIVKKDALSKEAQYNLENELKITPYHRHEEINKKYDNLRKNIYFLKEDIDGNIIENFFDIEETESKGTNILLSLLSFLFFLKENRGILFVDELDESLHPKLLIILIKLIYKLNWNIQLIFTAHNTILLKKSFDVFRKYQIWFVEKDFDGGSVLYSAGDTSVRKEKDLEELYLKGRFTDAIEDDLLNNF